MQKTAFLSLDTNFNRIQMRIQIRIHRQMRTSGENSVFQDKSLYLYQIRLI